MSLIFLDENWKLITYQICKIEGIIEIVLNEKFTESFLTFEQNSSNSSHWACFVLWGKIWSGQFHEAEQVICLEYFFFSFSLNNEMMAVYYFSRNSTTCSVAEFWPLKLKWTMKAYFLIDIWIKDDNKAPVLQDFFFIKKNGG